MASWLVPALKAVLPHVGTIISAASPAFTRKKTGAAAEQIALLQEQVGELQAAASQNAANIRELAAQLQGTIAALEQAALAAQASQKRMTLLCIAAVALSALAACAALFVALGQ